ncbi:SPRY domain-containing protein 3-like isoform X2 [Zootermopsis nevadensis]|uniref:SPRY domain-containing protein 3-like isoform X2 n=1 Tax=Zootermopsis nevadensis TaxID=136037 RepID=UPI000B8EB9BC|nr:SPRY domain-containing protein 3-like isoform X2 [Zootermopsis nevadensis]
MYGGIKCVPYMLSCVSPHLFELLKNLFCPVHDTTMEGLHNLQPYPVLRMKCSMSRDTDISHERIALDGDFLSYAPNEDDRVGVYIAAHPLTPDMCYYEAEIIDTGTDGSISVGLCSKRCPLDAHIGCATESIGFMTECGRLYKEGSRGTQLCIRCDCGDRIGCGIKFDQVLEGRGDPFCTMVPVYFARNGKELVTELVSLPSGGLYPAVGMDSVGGEVKLFLGLNWVPEEDSLMSVDTNEEEWYRLSDIQLNGQVLEYTGRGKSIKDVGLAQARSPLNTTVHYFEIEIVDPGESCYIAIGLTRRDYPKHRHPGWSKGSIGYHADDGKIFIGSGVGDPFGPRCHKGDRMGCGILFPRDYVCQYDSDGGSGEVSSSPTGMDNLLELTLDTSDSEDEDWWNSQCGIEHSSKMKVFFTRNGKMVGARQVCIPKGGFFPTIGMLSMQEKSTELH